MFRLIASLTAFLAILSQPLAARPCGAFFTTATSQNVALDAQRVLFVVRNSTIDMHIQPRALPSGDGAREPFVWIVPVPTQPTLALGDNAVFEALDTLTEPTVEIPMGGDGGGGGGFCGSADKAGGDGLDRDNGIQHFGGGVLGDYTYDILGGTTVEALAQWLTEHGYALPTTFSESVAPYAEKVLFVAVRLTDPGQSAIDLKPLVVSYLRPFDSALSYASGMSKISTTTTAPILLWVLADKRYRVANYGSAELSAVAREMRAEADAGEEVSYARAVARLTTSSGGRLVFTEFAKDLTAASTIAPALEALMDDDAHYLTRLYMEPPREAVEDLVITFAANAPDVEPFATAEAAARTPVTAGCLLVAIAFVAARRKRV